MADELTTEQRLEKAEETIAALAQQVQSLGQQLAQADSRQAATRKDLRGQVRADVRDAVAAATATPAWLPSLVGFVESLPPQASACEGWRAQLLKDLSKGA